MHMQSLSFSSYQPVGSTGPIPNQMDAKGVCPIVLGCFGFGSLKKPALEDIFRTCLGKTPRHKIWNKFRSATWGFNFCLLVLQ